MNPKAAESAICGLEIALNRGDPVGAYLACAQVLAELLALCYEESAQQKTGCWRHPAWFFMPGGSRFMSFRCFLPAFPIILPDG